MRGAEGRVAGGRCAPPAVAASGGRMARWGLGRGWEARRSSSGTKIQEQAAGVGRGVLLELDGRFGLDFVVEDA